MARGQEEGSKHRWSSLYLNYIIYNIFVCLLDTSEEEGRSIESWSWIQALERVSQALEETRTNVCDDVIPHCRRSFTNQFHFREAQA